MPIAIAKGIAFAFPDVCLTPAPPSPSPIPIPYPNIAQLADASPVSDASGKALLVGSSGDAVLLKTSVVQSSTGDEAGSSGGVTSGVTKGKCEISNASATVLYGPDGVGIVRFLDPTTQNKGNAVGTVLSAFPTVLVGG